MHVNVAESLDLDAQSHLTRRMVDSTQLTPPPLPSRLRPEQPFKEGAGKAKPIVMVTWLKPNNAIMPGM